jgi:FtsZ-interacting cell division protein ZipA
MKMIHGILAQSLIPSDVIPGGWRWMGLTFKELMILLGAVAIVTLMLVIWAAYFRKPTRHRSHHHHNHHESPEESDAEEYMASASAEGEGGRRYRRKRRRRREHRPRNPTLAETGGLPPLRADRPQDPLP